MPNKLTKESSKIVNHELGQFCKRIQNEVNNYLGFIKLVNKNDFCDTNISFDVASRNYMSLDFSVGYKEEMDGVFSLCVDITPRGILLHDGDRYLPASIRNTKCQIDPSNYVHVFSVCDFVDSPGYAYINKCYNELRKKIKKDVKESNSKDKLYIGNIKIKSFDLKFEPIQTVEYYKKVTNEQFYGNDKHVKDLAKKMSNLDNFSLDMPIPKHRKSDIGDAKRTKELLEIIGKYKEKKIKPARNNVRKTSRNHISIKDFFEKIRSVFKRKGKDEFETKDKYNLFKSNNIISVFLMIVPPIIFLINIILVLCLKEKFPVSLSSDLLWFNEAFTYKLCDIINNVISGNNNFFLAILLWICMVLAGILETLLSLIHLILFVIVFIIVAIYGFGFQTMVGAIILALALPITASILNKMSGNKITAPIISLFINIIIVALYLLCSYLVIGL